MLLQILLGFLPWVILNVLPKHTPEQFIKSIVLAIILAAIVNFKSLKKGFILSVGATIFLIIVLIIEIFYPNQWLPENIAIFSNAILAAISFVSLAVKFPFTLQYAREQRPKDKWHDPAFILINNILTVVWGVVFLFNLTVNILFTHYQFFNKLTTSIITNSVIVCGVLITIWLPKIYRNFRKNEVKL